MTAPGPKLAPLDPVAVYYPRPLLTLDQVAEMLGVSKGWVRDHSTRRSPRIPVVRFGGKRAVLRFRPQDIERFVADHLMVQQGGA
jgi:helix-turn-helix protein